MIVVGELDLTLPSLEEADRLSSVLFKNAYVQSFLGRDMPRPAEVR